MRSATAGCLALLLVAHVAGAEEKVPLNTITKVQVIGASVEIAGSQKPNFTQFTMTDPPRLVIDISDAVFSGVPESMDLGNGPVSGIKTASFGSDANAIARVIIGFRTDMETDVESKGNLLLVRINGGAAPSVAAAKGKSGGAGSAGELAQDGLNVQKSEPAAEEKRVAEEKQREEARIAKEEEGRKLEESQRAAEEKQREEARVAKQEEQRKLEESQRAAEEEKQRQREAAEAEKQAKIAAAAEAKREEQEAREATKREQQEAKLAKVKAAEEAKLAKEQAQEEATVAKERAAEEAKLAKQPAVDEARLAKQSAIEEANVAKERAADEVRASSRLDVSARRKRVHLVGFQQQPSSSRVFVQTNEPVRYRVNGADGKTIVIELENTSIGVHNNSRFLDTSYFDTAVAMVTPTQSPTRSVRIEIRLKEAVPFEAHQEGNEVFVDFPRPARR